MHNCWWNYRFVTDLVVKSWVRWSSTSGFSVNSSFPHDGARQKPLVSLQSFLTFQIFCPVSSLRPSKVFCFVIHLAARNECVHLQTRNLIICRQNNNMPNSCCVLWQLRSIKAAWKIRADDVSVLIAAFGPWSQDLPISTALVTLIYSWWIFQSGPMLIGCTYVCLHDDSV